MISVNKSRVGIYGRGGVILSEFTVLAYTMLAEGIASEEEFNDAIELARKGFEKKSRSVKEPIEEEEIEEIADALEDILGKEKIGVLLGEIKEWIKSRSASGKEE